MMRVFILGILLGLCGFSFAQKTTIEVVASVGDDDNGKSLSGATIEVYKNGALVTSESSASNGKVSPIVLQICESCLYTLKIKKPGYVTKTAVIDARYDFPEELPPGAIEQRFDVSLFKSVEGIDFSFLEKEPMVEFALDSYGMMTFDKDKIKVMTKKIEDLKKKMEEKKEQLEKEGAEQAKKEADFSAYVAAGDAAMKQQDYDKAIGQYELALAIKADNQPVKDKITDAKVKRDALLAKEQLDKDFSAKMQIGKDAYAKGELEKALAAYKEASALKPAEALPKTLIKEIEDEITKQKNNEAAFKQLVADGDGAVNKEDFDTGISKYEAALKLKKDAEVESKLAETKKLKVEKENALATEKANQVKYDQLMAKADSEFKAATYEAAKKTYQEAQALKPDETKPKTQITEIDKILKAQEADQAAKDKLEADYNKLMLEGKEKINQRTYPEAKAKFEEALKLKPADAHALAQLEIIKKELEKQAADAKLNAEYDAYMKDAKALFDQKKYTEAKSKYSDAARVKPSETEPQKQIDAINLIMQDAEKAAKAEADYTKFMETGNAANDRKDFAEALNNYKKALEIKPGDVFAQAKIDAINKTIEEQNKAAEEQKKFDEFVAAADQAYNAKDYDKAKLNYNNALGIKEDAALRKKIADIDEILAKNQSQAETKAKYDAAIKLADAAYKANQYQEALDQYKAALSILEDDYPKGKISELTEKIKAQEAADAKEKQFADLVAEGDKANVANDYSKALEKYKEAINIKPDPAITKKIGELNTKIAEDAQNADKKAKYDQKIAEANVAYDSKNWLLSKSLYEEAGRMMPSEAYPKDRLAEISKRIAEESNAEEAAKYQKIVDQADAYFKSDKLDEAKAQYDQALAFRPGDAYATGQIEKISALKKERADAIAAAKQKEEQYALLIKDAEKAENTSNWSGALEKYKEALKLKPSEAYPQTKIKEIEGKMGAAEVQKQKDAEYLALITAADKLLGSQDYKGAIKTYNDALAIKPTEQYPKDKIASAETFIKQLSSNEADEAYKRLLADAQAKFDQKQYQDALNLYQEAKRTKPGDELPERRINEINQIMAKSGEQAKLEEKYTDFLREADYRFEKGEWSKAKESYVEAYNVFNREYPERKIKECEDAMKQATSATENRQYDKIIKKADEYLAIKNYEQAKEYYNRALTFKPNDAYPQSKLAEIEAILNPNTVVKTQTTLTNYGQPNRSVNAVDVDRMMANAEAQRKFNEQQKVEQQRIDAQNAEDIKDGDQTEYNYETREDVIELSEDVEKADVAADEAIKTFSDNLVLVNEDNTTIEEKRVTYNENDVQLQNQVVNNINLEIDERDLESDQPREAYLADVEQIQLELIAETTDQDVNQTNVTYEEKEYVEEYVEQVEKDVDRMDIDRRNTEVQVEDKNVQLINENNSNSWNQEDVVMQIKGETETFADEQTQNQLAADLPRVEGVGQLEIENIELSDIESSRQRDQYDVNMNQKNQTENLMTETELAAVGSDIPRQKMEDFTEDQSLESIDVNSELVVDQDNVLYESDLLLDNQEIELAENKVEADLNREGYEEVVEVIFEDADQFIDNKASDTENNSHTTVDYLEDNSTDRTLDETQADRNADNLIDHTSELVEDLDNVKDDGVEETNEKLEESEEFVESLRDIDVTKVDDQMKNALGDQFPEGVTEEIYTINDEDGLMVSYIVRRVVVKNGAGNVYEKVQTKFGTTSYTCNGYGISEYDWQDKTEAAHLVRN